MCANQREIKRKTKSHEKQESSMFNLLKCACVSRQKAKGYECTCAFVHAVIPTQSPVGKPCVSAFPGGPLGPS